MNKIKFNEILKFANNIISSDNYVNTFEGLTNDNLTDEYLNVLFINKYNGFNNSKFASKDGLIEITKQLEHERRLRFVDLIKISYALLQNITLGKNEVTNLEKVAAKYSEATPGFQQNLVLNNLNEILNNYSFNTIKTAKELVLIGGEESLNEAKNILKALYSSIIKSENIKTAGYTFTNQFNEPYLLCPKALKTVGYTIPMEVSKCRDYCVESRTDNSGHTTCNYSAWLKTITTQKDALAMLDTYINQNEENRINLKEGERAKPLLPVEKGLEERSNDSRKSKKIIEKSFEAQLHSDSPAKKDDYDDKFIEALLEDSDKFYSDEELDVLEEMLEEYREN